MKIKKALTISLSLVLTASLMGCSAQNSVNNQPQFPGGQNFTDPMSSPQTSTETVNLDVSDQFSERDLSQSADLSEAVQYSVTDDQDITINAAGVYVISGKAENVTVFVEAGDDDKVQLVLDNLTITNESKPCV